MTARASTKESATGELQDVLLALGDVTEPKVDQRGPTGGEFVYVDIGSVDNGLKRIVETKALSAEHAPSRAKQRLRAGDVLVSMTRPNLNAVAMVPPELDGAIGSTGFHVLRANDGTDPRWLYYAVQTRAFVSGLSDLVQGALYPAVRPKDIRAFQVPHPPAVTQRRLVAEIEKQFSRLDEAVTNLNRVKANLKRYKAAVLKAAVEGRLVETEAELARGEGRNFESGAELLRRVSVEHLSRWGRPRESKESQVVATEDLPALPRAWTWCTVGDLAELGTGATPNRSQTKYWEGGHVPWVTSAVVNEPYVDTATEFVTSAALDETNLTLYSPGTLVLAMYGEGRTRGKCAELRIAATTNQALAALQVDASLRPYLKVFFQYYYEHLRRMASGGVQPNLNLGLVRNIHVPLPPIAEQNRISQEVEIRLSIADQLDAELARGFARSSALRVGILDQAFLGRRRVP